MWLFGKKEPGLEEQINGLLRVRVRGNVYHGATGVPNTRYLSVSKDFRKEVAFEEIRRVVRKAVDPDHRKNFSIHNLAIRLHAYTTSMYEYEVAGFPVIFPAERDGLPVSHRELHLFDYDRIAGMQIEEINDAARQLMRGQQELDYAKLLHMINLGINPCRAEYLRMRGEQGDYKWLFKSDEGSYEFSAGIWKKMDKPDVQEAEVVYKVNVVPQADTKEPFKVTVLEARVMIYMKPRKEDGQPDVEEAHIRMGCFVHLDRTDGRVTSKVTRRMEGTLRQEAEDPCGWRFNPDYDYLQSIERIGHFMSALRHGSERLPSYIGHEGLFVLNKKP